MLILLLALPVPLCIVGIALIVWQVYDNKKTCT